MSRLTIDTGTAGNPATGDSLRTAFNKVNTNFTELYAELGGDSLDAISFNNNTISTDITNANLILTGNGTGGVIIEDIEITGSTVNVLTTNNNLTLNTNGTGKVVINGLSFPTTDGTAGQVLKTDGAGNLSFTAVDPGAITIVGDDSSGTAVNIGETFKIAGSGTVTTAVSGDTITITGSASAQGITFVGDDSTGTRVSDGEAFKIAGTQNITTAVSGDTLTITGPDLSSYLTSVPKTIDVNAISSSDSSAIQINDAINVSGLLTANAGLTINNNSNTWLFGSNGATTLPAGGTITEGVVTSNPTIQLTPATPTVASQKLVIKGGGSYSFTTNGININYYVNTGTSGDTLTFYVYSDTYANQTLYWWIYPVGVGMTTPDSGTVVLSGAGGNFSVGIDSDAYEFTVRVSPEADNYNAGSIGVESGLINADAPPFTSEHHLHLTTGNLTETSIFLGTDDHNVRTTTAGNIQITTPNTTNKVWEFGTNGVLTFPDSTTQNTAARITVVGDDSTGTTLNAGETIKIAGTQNITTAVSGDTLTITGPNLSSYATTTYVDNKVSANNTLTIADDTSTTSSINLDNTLQVIGGNNITTTISGNVLTVTGSTNVNIDTITPSDSSGVQLIGTLNTRELKVQDETFEGYENIYKIDNKGLLFHNKLNQNYAFGNAQTKGIMMDHYNDGYYVKTVGSTSGSSHESKLTFDFRELSNNTDELRKGVLKFLATSPGDTSVTMSYEPGGNLSDPAGYYTFKDNGFTLYSSCANIYAGGTQSYIGFNYIRVDSVDIKDNTITTNSSNANLELSANGSGTIIANSPLKINAGYIEKINALTSSSTITVNCAAASIHTVTLAVSTGFVISNLPTGGTVTLIITQGGSGSYTATFGTDGSTTVKFPGGAPTLSTAVGAIDVVTIFNDGTNYLGNIAKAYAA